MQYPSLLKESAQQMKYVIFDILNYQQIIHIVSLFVARNYGFSEIILFNFRIFPSKIHPSSTNDGKKYHIENSEEEKRKQRKECTLTTLTTLTLTTTLTTMVG